MNIYETIDLLKTKLEENQNNPSDLMYGYKIVIDPYSDLSKQVPLVLLEAEKSVFVNSGEYGSPAMQDHIISATVMEEAQKASFTSYKSKVNVIAKKVIDKLMTFSDWRINRIEPTEMTHDELMLGALKVSAITIELKVRTNW